MVGCASNPATRRADLLAAADREAKAAIITETGLDPSRIPDNTFAVLPFAVGAGDTLLRPLGFALADFLVTDLSRTPQLSLVERLRTNAMLRELSLLEAGVTDPDQAPRVGRLIGARRLLMGVVTRVGAGAVRFDARVIDVVDGTVQTVASAEAPLERVIDAEKALALLVLERLAITVTPAQRQRIEARQTTDLAALVAYGRGVEAEARGDAVAAAAAYEEASRLDAAFSSARLAAEGTPEPLGETAGPPGAAVAGAAASSMDRVLDLSARAVNLPVPVRVAEAADAPLATGAVLTILLRIRITP